MNEQEAVCYSVYVGIDWADSKHDVCIQPKASQAREFDVIPHRAETIDTWVTGLHQRYEGRIAVAVELSKGPIVSALQKYDFIDIFPVNPSTLAKYREAFQPSKAKDDPTDAELAVDMLLRLFVLHEIKYVCVRAGKLVLHLLAERIMPDYPVTHR